MGAFGVSTTVTGTSNTHIPREWTGRLGAPPLQIGMQISQSGSSSHGKSGSTEHILNPFPQGREVLRMICCCFIRGSMWRSTVCTARSYCSVGVYQVSVCPLPELEPNPKGILYFSFLPLPRAQPMPSKITDTSNSNGSPA